MRAGTRLAIDDGAIKFFVPLLGVMALLASVMHVAIAFSTDTMPSAPIIVTAVYFFGGACVCLWTIPRLWRQWKSGNVVHVRRAAFLMPYPLLYLWMKHLVEDYGWKVIPSSQVLSAVFWLVWISVMVVTPFLVEGFRTRKAEQSLAAESR